MIYKDNIPLGNPMYYILWNFILGLAAKLMLVFFLLCSNYIASALQNP